MSAPEESAEPPDGAPDDVLADSGALADACAPRTPEEEAYAVLSAAVFRGRGPVRDDVARHLREDLIARAGAADEAGEGTVAVPLLAVRLLVQVLSTYGPPDHLLLAMLDLAAVDAYMQHRSTRRPYTWHVAPDAWPAMRAAMRVQPAVWIIEPLVTAETHLFGSPVRVDPALAPGAIYLRPDDDHPAPGGA